MLIPIHKTQDNYLRNINFLNNLDKLQTPSKHSSYSDSSASWLELENHTFSRRDYPPFLKSEITSCKFPRHNNTTGHPRLVDRAPRPSQYGSADAA